MFAVKPIEYKYCPCMFINTLEIIYHCSLFLENIFLLFQMKFNKLENFASNFTKHRKGKYSSALEQAVVEALEVLDL
jgi:hypothetical protein